MSLVQTTAQPPLMRPEARTRARVLVIDDESRIRLALRACLEAEGYLVDEAADGVEGIECLRRHLPQLIILDLSMPRMSGLEMLDELPRHCGPSLPKVIILTARGSPESASDAYDKGATAFLEKPLLPDVLRREVERML